MPENLHPSFTDIFISLGMITKPENTNITLESHQKEATNYDADKSVEIGRLKAEKEATQADMEQLLNIIEKEKPTMAYVQGFLTGIYNQLKK